MFKILVSDPLSHQGIQALLNADDVQVDEKTGMSEEELLQVIPAYDALVVRSQTKVTPAVFAAAERLRIIGRAGVGVDNIDLEAATDYGVIVVNAPDGNTLSAAEHTFAMMMAGARLIPQAHKSLTAGQWDRKAFRGVELNNKTLGVVGFGRIGQEVAQRAKAFHMNIVAYDPFLTEEKADKAGVTLASVDEVAEMSDFITVHTPMTKETYHLISTDQFNKMKKGVRLMNCARGGIIDEDALYTAIKDGIVAGVSLDVFEQEPPTDHPLLTLPEVVVTPHLGASTEEAQENVAVDVSKEILHVLRDQPFKNAVNLPSVSSETMRILKPYFTLAEKIGEMTAQLTAGTPVDIQLTYAGELTEVDVSPLTRTMVKGVLSYYLGAKVNDVNATQIARQREVAYNEEKTPKHKGFSSLITMTLTTDQETHSISGTILNGYGPRIVKIDGYSIDISPQDHLLLVRHTDRPGMIGRVGTLLGEHGVNIATMQVGRKDIGGRAIMMLTIDKEATPEALDNVLQMEDITNIQQIEL